MPPAARLGDDMTHSGGKLGPVTTGVTARVNIGGQPAACKGDAFLCPLAEPGPVPHVGGTIQAGSATVKIGGQPAARVGDLGKCEAGTAPNPIMKGENTVNIGDSGGGGGAGAGSVGSGGTGEAGSAAGSSSSNSSPISDGTTGTSGTGGKTVISSSNVEVKTGVTITRDGTPSTTHTDAISIELKCSTSPKTVQFIYREIIGADGKPIKRTMHTTGGVYETTTNPANPNWNTDSNAKPDPRYEAGGAHSTTAGSLTIYDQPALRPAVGETWRATFKTFLICNGKVIEEVTWVRTQKYGASPSYSVTSQKATELPQWAKDKLKEQGYNPIP